MKENTEDTVQQPPLIVSEDMRSYIYDMAKWANFLAIVGFVIAGFLVLASFTIGSAMRTDPKLAAAMAASAFSPLGVTIFCLVCAFSVFYPSLLLFKYAVQAKIGVLYGEQSNLDEALGKMKSLFKFWGIITIALLSLYIVFIVIGIITATAGMR